LPNNDIFRRLAKRLGFEEDNFKWSDSECLENYVDWNSPACEGIDLDYLRKHGFAHLKVGGRDDRAPHRGIVTGRHVDVAAPLDRPQAGFGREPGHLLDGQLPHRDRAEPGHDRARGHAIRSRSDSRTG
jgi:hypothetical protein